MKPGYHFRHVLENGKVSGLFSKQDTDIEIPGLAQSRAFGYARQLAKQGVTAGKVTVEGYWGANGFSFEIGVLQATQTRHPLEDLPQEDLPYGLVEDTITRLWPFPEEGSAILKEETYHFTVYQGRVDVTLSRPRGRLTTMVCNDRKVEGYHSGPSLFRMMVLWNISEVEARNIWEEVMQKVKALRVLYDLPEYGG